MCRDADNDTYVAEQVAASQQEVAELREAKCRLERELEEVRRQVRDQDTIMAAVGRQRQSMGVWLTTLKQQQQQQQAPPPVPEMQPEMRQPEMEGNNTWRDEERQRLLRRTERAEYLLSTLSQVVMTTPDFQEPSALPG
jgi:hypothetical protein